MPRPPAWVTAAASLPPAAEPIGARRIGCWIPSSRVSAVSIVAMSARASVVVELEARSRPLHHAELALVGECDVRGAHVRSAEADIGRVDVGHLHLARDLSVGRELGD